MNTLTWTRIIFHHFLTRENLKLLVQNINRQKMMLKEGGITVDGKHYDVQFTGICMLLLAVSNI